MTIRRILRIIKGVFKPPVKRYYFGKIIYGTPYFNPRNFCNTIVEIRKLKPLSQIKIEEQDRQYPHLRHKEKYVNLPLVRRVKNRVVSIFGCDYWIAVGWPIYITWHDLGWRDKWDTPRFEWPPAFYIFFFKWQFVIRWAAPDDNDDNYFAQILWYAKYSDCDIEKARKTWPWINSKTKKSTWRGDYIV